MDPISITAGISSIVFTLVKTGKQFYTIFECFQDAQRSLFMIQTECTVLAAALSQIQGLFSPDERGRKRVIPKTVFDALEMSLIGCTMTLSVLSAEIGSVVSDIEISQTLKRKQKAKYVWKEDRMTSLAQQLSRQSVGLTLLLKAMESSTVDQARKVLDRGQQVFGEIQHDAMTIRESMPHNRFPASIAELSVAGGQSLYDLLKDQDEEDLLNATHLDDKRAAPKLAVDRTLVKDRTPPQETSRSRALQKGPKPHLLIQNESQESKISPMPVIPVPDRGSRLDKDQIGRKINDVVEKSGILGISVALLENGRSTIFSKGLLRLGSDDPITDSSLWYLPLSYQFLLPVVICRLVDKKILLWSSKILELLPHLRSEIHADHADTTVEMLLRHTSGVDTGISSLTREKLLIGSPKRSQFLEGIVKEFLFLGVEDRGGKFQRHIANCYLLVLVIETLTGKSFQEILQDEVFSPLGMKNSRITITQLDMDELSKTKLVWGHDLVGNTPLDMSKLDLTDYTAPGEGRIFGRVFSTIDNVSKFLGFCLHNNGDSVTGQPFLKPITFEKFCSPTFVADAGDFFTLGGWYVPEGQSALDQSRRSFMIYDNVSIFMEVSMLAKRGYAILANTGGGYAALKMSFMMEAIKEELLGPT